MKRVGFLFEKIITFENLVEAVYRAARGKKMKHSVARYFLDYEKEVITLQEELATESYDPMPYHQFTVFEPKVRRICSSEFRDRVVHHAICGVIEPYFERRLIYDTYACRVGKGSHMALKRCQDFSRHYGYFLKCDIAKYFESVHHDTLKKSLAEIFKDAKLLRLLDKIIHHGVPGAAEGRGLPIGNLTSQHFANLYLGELDHFAKENLRVPGYIRYMDDFLLFHESKEFLHEALQKITEFVQTKLSLQLKDKVTRIAPVSEGVPFLGFHVFPKLIRVQRPNLVRMRRKIRDKERDFTKGRISEKELFQSMNSILGHIAQANSTALRRKEATISLKLA